MAGLADRRVARTALVALLPPALALLLTLALGRGLPEWIFFSVCFVAAGTGGWFLSRAATRALRQQRRADALARVNSELVVREAVMAEQHRLSADITADLQTLLVRVGELASTGGPGSAEQIHQLTRLAAADLRRQLGLLRDPMSPPEPTPVARRRLRIRGADGCLAIGVAALAGVEAWWYPQSEGLDTVPGSVPMTILAALPLVALRKHPALVAASVGIVQLVALGSGMPVTHGFWILVAVGAPLWRLAAHPGKLPTVSACGLLITGTVLTGALTAVDDLGVLVAVVVLALGGGLFTGQWQRREARARSAADRRATDLREATTAAVEARRAAYAREIHDTVSYAVGVIAMQASVAHVGSAAAARGALAMIHEVADAALSELDRHGDEHVPPPSATSIEAVVDRMRAAGMTVTLDGLDQLPADHAGLACRIVQEGLTNIARHACGAEARITVTSVPEEVIIVITDDGPGPRPGQAPGYGLIGLRERIGYVGGSLDLVPGATGGCRLSARLPRTEVTIT